MQRMINISLTAEEDTAIQMYLAQKEIKLATLVKELLLLQTRK